ncbi:hypothetical protein HZU72_07225 [Halomonas sp. QX-2]|uniref:Uncharacterized protein n=1 Tax=Vreelandella sedimenti TaxID=2729618 RepID=A0A7Z0SMJ8_9GAMM|nr:MULTISPECIES: hypothetical protein [Halomonas]NYT72218.1 hypothetical protein [Halomonas sedimenti]
MLISDYRPTISLGYCEANTHFELCRFEYLGELKNITTTPRSSEAMKAARVLA